MHRVRSFAIGLLLASLASPVAALVVEDTVSLQGVGGIIVGTSGLVVPLTPHSFLVGTNGPDQMNSTADDAVVLVENVGVPGTTPTTTPLATPYLSHWSQRVRRLSPTRAVVAGLGDDAVPASSDDTLFLLDDLGGANTVTPIPVAQLTSWEHSAPVPLGTDSIVLSSKDTSSGPSMDDVVYVVSDLGGSNTVTPLSAPWAIDPRQPLVLSPTTFLVSSAGPDAETMPGMSVGTGDELVYVFHDAGAGFVRTDVPMPDLQAPRGGQGMRVSPTSALFSTYGPDHTAETADDLLVLLEDATGVPTTTPIAAPSLLEWGASSPVLLRPGVVAVASAGANETDRDADDALYVVTDLGGANTVTPVVVGPISDGALYRPHPLSADRFVIAGVGPDMLEGTADDLLLTVSDVGGGNVVTPTALGGLDWGAAQHPLALAPDALLIPTGGMDGALGGGDDEMAQATALGGAALLESVPMGGDITQCCQAAFAPQLLGKGRAAHGSSGADGTLGEGDDDAVQVLGDVPSLRDLTVQKLSVKFDPARPEKGEKASLKATLTLDGIPPLGSTDLVVSIAGASQVIPASELVQKKKSVVYKDGKNERGIVRKLSFQTEKGTLKIKTRGVGTGMEGVDPAKVAVALEWLVFDRGHYLSDAFAAEAVKKGVQYKLPK